MNRNFYLQGRRLEGYRQNGELKFKYNPTDIIVVPRTGTLSQFIRSNFNNLYLETYGGRSLQFFEWVRGSTLVFTFKGHTHDNPRYVVTKLMETYDSLYLRNYWDALLLLASKEVDMTIKGREHHSKLSNLLYCGKHGADIGGAYGRQPEVREIMDELIAELNEYNRKGLPTVTVETKLLYKRNPVIVDSRLTYEVQKIREDEAKTCKEWNCIERVIDGETYYFKIRTIDKHNVKYLYIIDSDRRRIGQIKLSK